MSKRGEVFFTVSSSSVKDYNVVVFLSNAAILHLVVFFYKYNLYKLNLNQIIEKFCHILTVH